MNLNLTSIATLLAASFLVGPVGCDSDPDSDSKGAAGTGNAGPGTGSSGEDTEDTEDTEAGTTQGLGDDDSTGGAPADCSCYDPAVDDVVDPGLGCLDRSTALPGCMFETSPCAPIEQLEFKNKGPSGPPSPEGAVTCVLEALAQGQTPPFTRGTSTYISGSTSNHTPRDDGSYIRDTCSFYDSAMEQSVDVIMPADAKYFAACLENNADDESSMYTCLLEGLTAQDDVFPTCG